MARDRHVFLSHARLDQPVAAPLIAELRRREIRIWPDVQLGAETQVLPALRAAIRTSAVFVVLLTRTSMHRPWVQWEVGLALTTAVPVVPVLGPDCPCDAPPFDSLLGHRPIPIGRTDEILRRVASAFRSPEDHLELAQAPVR